MLKDTHAYKQLVSLSKERTVLKTIEELNELQQVLIKYLTKNKPGEFNIEDLYTELVDTALCLTMICEQFELDPEKIYTLRDVKVVKAYENYKKYGFNPNIVFTNEHSNEPPHDNNNS